MIDERRIEEAKENIFNKHFLNKNEDVVCIDHVAEPVYLDYQIKEAIGLGAKWAVNEFQKDLWHPASEEPDRMKEIIAYGFYATTIVKWCPNGYITWKDYYEKWHYTQWLYIEDLLPKKGGENEGV